MTRLPDSGVLGTFLAFDFCDIKEERAAYTEPHV